jgi:hypothetical protein
VQLPSRIERKLTRYYWGFVRRLFIFMLGSNARIVKSNFAIQCSQAIELNAADWFLNSEPMVTQAILNEVVKHNFQIKGKDVVNDLFLGGTFFMKQFFGLRVIGFNEQFQNKLFPAVNFEMANNIWAQAYSVGVYAMVGIFAIVYSLVLAGMSFLFARAQGVLLGCIAIVSGWWGFYLHRNDIYIGVTIIKVTLAIMLLSWVSSWLISHGGNYLQRTYSRIKK